MIACKMFPSGIFHEKVVIIGAILSNFTAYRYKMSKNTETSYDKVNITPKQKTPGYSAFHIPKHVQPEQAL